MQRNNPFILVSYDGNEIDLTSADYFDAKTSSLNLSRKRLYNTDIPTIVEFLKAHPEVTSLNLSSNFIDDDESVKRLVGVTTLRTLDLSANDIGPMSAKELAKSTTLTELNLNNNNIQDRGAIALASNTSITSLDITQNQINAKGAMAFAESTTRRTLRIGRNHFPAESAEALAKNTALTVLYGEARIEKPLPLPAKTENKTSPNTQKQSFLPWWTSILGSILLMIAITTVAQIGVSLLIAKVGLIPVLIGSAALIGIFLAARGIYNYVYQNAQTPHAENASYNGTESTAGICNALGARPSPQAATQTRDAVPTQPSNESTFSNNGSVPVVEVTTPALN